ncbi:hypothetical protein [Candidatus Chloroploca asiatica]|uniref:Uncharacterized protein n=1 Tax=Candidatus Chloroploca asiatica TaxID=1506545 RepID=A0A2H3KQM3_9CHLR|nr:hypothetical protein [Candidatus Chloroploca asiatica]PDW00719.1 hypothetical protein A9Q02_08870 [Candidatus Chloroploca asiatica]
MAIDTIRLLTDSAAQLYATLDRLRPLGDPDASFDVWRAGLGMLDDADEQQLRRNYRRLLTMIAEIEGLVCSHATAIALVRAHAIAIASESCQLTQPHGSGYNK